MTAVSESVDYTGLFNAVQAGDIQAFEMEIFRATEMYEHASPEEKTEIENALCAGINEFSPPERFNLAMLIWSQSPTDSPLDERISQFIQNELEGSDSSPEQSTSINYNSFMESLSHNRL